MGFTFHASRFRSTAALAALLVWCSSAVAEDFVLLCADRAAIERVYFEHRTGPKPPFEQGLTPAALEELVHQDLRKEAALKKVYGVEIKPAMLAAEVQRIATTTRAPETLGEIRHALGDDAGRFARSVARPILVERELRFRFDNDDQLHVSKRHQAERARENLLAKIPVEGVRDVTWQVTSRPKAGRSASPTPLSAACSPPLTSTGGAYSVEATARVAQVINPPGEERERDFYFEDLDPELQRVLWAQLRKPGDVSAVIETRGGFLVFLAKEMSAATLRAASLSIPKRSYEEWLAQQTGEKP